MILDTSRDKTCGGSFFHGGTCHEVLCNVVDVMFQLCYKLYLDPTCQEHWDEESSTPWAACANEFYSFENQKSVQAKVSNEYIRILSSKDLDCDADFRRFIERNSLSIRKLGRQNALK